MSAGTLTDLTRAASPPARQDQEERRRRPQDLLKAELVETERRAGARQPPTHRVGRRPQGVEQPSEVEGAGCGGHEQTDDGSSVGGQPRWSGQQSRCGGLPVDVGFEPGHEGGTASAEGRDDGQDPDSVETPAPPKKTMCSDSAIH